MYTRAISETLSQMPLNQTLLRADISDNVSDIPVEYQPSGSFSRVVNFEKGRGEWWLSRPNNSSQGTSRGPAGKVGGVTRATPLNSNR